MAAHANTLKTGRLTALPSGGRHAALAQSAERFTRNEQVVGSIPTGGSYPDRRKRWHSMGVHRFLGSSFRSIRSEKRPVGVRHGVLGERRSYVHVAASGHDVATAREVRALPCRQGRRWSWNQIFISLASRSR
jgi:hypothetical protein